MNTHDPVYIISGERADRDATANANRSVQLRADLARAMGAEPKPVTGCYKGEIEWSFVVLADRPDVVRRLAAQYGQESILYLDANRYAWLEYVDSGEVEPLGQWREVRRGETPDAYTVADGRAYTAA